MPLILNLDYTISVFYIKQLAFNAPPKFNHEMNRNRYESLNFL